jgi:4-hydroxybenzoate polyprenyltransferase
VTAPFVWTLLCVFFGYANFVLAGYFKDIAADRATGYRTYPVVFGRRPAALVSDGLATATLIAAWAAAFTTDARMEAVPTTLLCSGVVATVFSQMRLHRVRADEEAHRAIVPGLYGYVLLLAGLISLVRPSWTGPLIVYALLFVLVMRARPEQHQI